MGIEYDTPLIRELKRDIKNCKDKEIKSRLVNDLQNLYLSYNLIDSRSGLFMK